MGLTLFPADGDGGSPDAGWSYSGFHAFRRQLARAEGFDLDEMRGFGGERAWSDVSTALVPFLDRADNGGGVLSVAECASLLPRLEAIVEQWWNEAGVPRTHVDAARRLMLVLRVCVAKDVELLFG
ncbi:hypothetical protein [Streptomyces sp. NPDC089919]|uniref:hypothetical protein n=1 Tax=Streptomyces sp. NPDC089919 TaxID=3155188 RepID=UPI00343FA870